MPADVIGNYARGFSRQFSSRAIMKALLGGALLLLVSTVLATAQERRLDETLTRMLPEARAVCAGKSPGSQFNACHQVQIIEEAVKKWGLCLNEHEVIGPCPKLAESYPDGLRLDVVILEVWGEVRSMCNGETEESGPLTKEEQADACSQIGYANDVMELAGVCFSYTSWSITECCKNEDGKDMECS